MRHFESYLNRVRWNSAAQHLKWRSAPEGIIPMASGEHDFPPPRDLFQKTINAFENHSSAYGPLNGLPEVRQEIARHIYSRRQMNIAEDYVHLVPTVSIGLALVANAMQPRGKAVIFIGVPVYYAIAAPVISTGAAYDSIDVLNPEWKTHLTAAIGEQTAALYMANPHSPTGHMFSAEDLTFISDICEKNDVLIISDDVYECMPLRETYTPIYKISEYSLKNSIVFGGFAKCFNVCGVSASYCICDPSLFSDICRHFGGPVFMCNLSSQFGDRRLSGE